MAQGAGDDGEPPASLTTELKVDKTRKGKLPAKPEKNHRRKFSESKLLRSLSGMGRSKSKLSPSGSKSPSPSPSSEAVTADAPVARTPSRDAPVMSRMLEAKAELSLRPSFDLPRPRHTREGAIAEEQTSSSLAKQLMDIFEFETAEDVIEGMPPLVPLGTIHKYAGDGNGISGGFPRDFL